MNLNFKYECWLSCILVGAHKGSERVPVQFLSSLSLSEPTAGVPEVWEGVKADRLLLIGKWYKCFSIG
jgi:hypothetical protein